MAHFVRLDENSIVVQGIVIQNNELIDNGAESEAKGIAFCQSLFPGTIWIQTSYNGRIRKNYAGIGYTYDAGRDAFIPTTPYPSWLLDETTCQWVPPVPMPEDGGLYTWDEAAGEWVTG
jgi:hypothetical protein